jgi:hypothetical protein
MPIIRLEKDWGQVLLSRRPEIAVRLAQQFIAPTLQRAAQEETSRQPKANKKIEWAISQHLLWGVWRDPKQLQPELQQDIPFIIASKTYNAGVSKRTTYMQIMDVGLVFGQPKVALTLTTCDITPNPEYSIKKAAENGKARLADSSLFGTNIQRLQRYLTDRFVPAESIKPVLAQLKENNITSELASTALAWVKTTPAEDKTPERQPQEAAQSGTISVETIALNDIFPDTDDSRTIESYQELPQGNALFATTRYDREQQSKVAELYITKPADPRQVTQLWQGKRLSRLILVHQGAKAWFEAFPRQWFSLDISNHKITAMTAAQTESDAYSLASWFNDMHDEPVAYYTDHSDEGKGCLVFRRMDPPSGDGKCHLQNMP